MRVTTVRDTVHNETGNVAHHAWRQKMIAVAAGAAFVGLFALWVIVPRFILRRHEKSAQTATPPMAREEFAPQAAD